jgi:ketosteroid isomerase-like protein
MKYKRQLALTGKRSDSMRKSNWAVRLIGANGAIRFAVLAMAAVCVPAGFWADSAAAPKPPAQVAAGAEQAGEESQILKMLSEQADAWNHGDIDSFMTSYWKSDETLFVGASGVIRGWQAVLARYHRVYPDRKAMGHLTFSNMEAHRWCADSAFVLGNFHLDRENDHPEGIFTLDLRKFPEGWRIVADHTTAFPAAQPAKSQ